MIYRFIENIGDYFTPGYYTEDFKDKVIQMYLDSLDTREATEKGDADSKSAVIKTINAKFSGLKAKYYAYKDLVKDNKLHKKYIIKETHDFNSEVMSILGYDTTPAYSQWIHIDDHSVVPARSVLFSGDKARLVIMEMQPMIKFSEDDQPAGLFEQRYNDDESVTREQRYYFPHWNEVIHKEIPEGCKISPSKINEAVSAIFSLPEQRPQYILLLAGNVIMLLEQDKWDHGAYLKFDLEELFSEASIDKFKDYYTLFYLLASKEVLAGDAHLLEQINEESYKNAYEVTKDLKEGVINAVEMLANEAIHFKKQVLGETFDETDDAFEANVKDDCLTIIYRLLFIFYAEARPEIGILPMNDDCYAKGYSLDILRDLEQTPLKSDQERNSYFFNDSLWTLFRLISSGYKDNGNVYKSFTVKKIDSPLFDDEKLKVLKGIKFRNCIWQEIICSLSLSSEKSRKSRGRISYANLGVNQLGSVYESLLAYRGFYAEEDYIEVHKAGAPEDGTFLVPRSRMADFHDDEILHKANGEIEVLEKGKFVYRLNGRDRKKSASYYTPEILTKSTVKYTLKGFVERLEKEDGDPEKMKAEELLNLKILEPAMGAAAFQNEVINQVAELYLQYRQKETGKHIEPHKYRDELQKVKAYIATKNIYGVDLNPTAIELGKLSLWLNVIHKDMETPFFGHRIALGNAVIGAWFKAYDESELCKVERGRLVNTEWWNKAPHLLHFSRDRKKIIRKAGEIYHFLVPDKNMLGVLKISEEKAANPQKAKAMANFVKEWTKPMTKEEILMLRRLSQGIDKLISDYIVHQEKVEKLTANNYNVWEHRTYRNEVLQMFDDKQELVNSRNAKNNAFYKLKTIMDYWCALWFWEYDDAVLLPESRMDYWMDIQGLIGMSFAPSRTAVEEPEATPDMFAATEETEDTTVYTKQDANEILSKYKSSGTLFEENERIPVVQKLSERYHFFHPMLEFIEVFWLRDGFDIICGNPPWIKLEFDEKDIISEQFPEVAIRKISAPDVRKMKELFLSNITLARIYKNELYENNCSTQFLNAYSNYSLLAGQQTNLYKCVLVNCMDQVSDNGFVGLLTPESIYDDPNGQPLRKELYAHLQYHFQYQNELRLFAEVHHHTRYGGQLLRGRRSSPPCFASLSNLYHPSTVDACFVHDGTGICGGIKDSNGNWNTAAHKSRIIHYSDNELQVLSNTFEDGVTGDCAKLVSLQSCELLSVLEKISSYPTRLKDAEYVVSNCFHETGAVDNGIIKRNTCIPCNEQYDMIYNGPSFYVGNPLYKTPRAVCRLNSDYDNIDLTQKDNIQRTNYTPCLTLAEYKNQVPGFKIGEDEKGHPIFDSFLDYYKVTMRCMLSQAGERTLICAVLPRKTAHIHAVISVAFRNIYNCVDMAAMMSSLPIDFFTKTIGIGQIGKDMLSKYPFGFEKKYLSPLRSRILLLNCLSMEYSDLWKSVWSDEYKKEEWSITDKRLKPYHVLSSTWEWSSPLRNQFERRQALIEIDVIVAIALGLSLKDLILIYSMQFAVLQQNENDTWYDNKGNIVFTCSKGLTGVGVDRITWEQIRNQKEGETYVHTIDPAKSELYGGQQVTYYAPYTKCDRIEDYRRAWAHFENIFKESNDGRE